MSLASAKASDGYGASDFLDASLTGRCDVDVDVDVDVLDLALRDFLVLLEEDTT